MTEQKKSPEISIIVPVYKVEKYLNECIDSILAQTFTDFELILVDDGSPDNCPALCDAAAEKDSRVRVIHKINGGVSTARNAGLAAAQGNWIGFVDPDDFVDKTSTKKCCGQQSRQVLNLQSATKFLWKRMEVFVIIRNSLYVQKCFPVRKQYTASALRR